MKRILGSTIALVLGAAISPFAPAQVFPAKSIRLIVAFPTGGATDTFSRVTAAELTRSLGQQVIVENRPGAGTTIAAEFVAKAPPDGYTLLFTDLSTHTITASLYTKLQYHPLRDFAPVAAVNSSPLLLVAHPSVGVKSVRELVALAKRNPRAIMGAGMRMVLAVSCFDKNKSVTGLMPQGMIENTQRCVAKTEELFEKYPGKHAGRLTVSASFRGMNNSSDELILALKDVAQQRNAILQTHACYSYFTVDSSIAQHGKPEIERLESLVVLDENMLLLHSGWFEPHEIAILVRRKPTLVCCPSSSLHNGYGNLAVGKHPELMALGVNVSLGTDHASSGTVDLVQEMRNCACGYKEIRLNPRVMPPEHAVEMATINGARGAGLADRLGSIEIGKEADFVLFDASVSEWQPLYNPVSNLVYSATGNTVKHVFVAGEQVVRDGRLVRIDQDEVMREVVKAGERITGRLDMKKVMKLRWPVE